MAEFTLPVVTFNGVTQLDNFYLQTLVKDSRDTALDHQQFVTVDNSLQGVDGMNVQVATYIPSGEAEVVAEGKGNTKATGITLTQVTHETKMAQAYFEYTDEQLLRDPMSVQAGVSATSNAIVNKMNADIIAAFLSIPTSAATQVVTVSGTAYYDAFVDAQALLDLSEVGNVGAAGEGNAPEALALGTFALVGKKQIAAIRKACREDLDHTEPYVRTGFIGSLAGTPIYYDKLMDATANEKKIVLATPKAVTLYVKQAVEVEQAVKNSRGKTEANQRLNDIFVRQVYLAALTDASKGAVISVAEG